MDGPLKKTPIQPDDSTTRSEKSSSETRVPDEPPIKKNRSPYNLFYLIERQLLLSEIDPKLSNLGEHASFLDDAITEPELPARYRNVGIANPLIVIERHKRRHRKVHGKIGFVQLCRSIAERWRASDSATKQYFRALSAADMVRFKKEREFYFNKREILKKKQEQESKSIVGRNANIKDGVIPSSVVQTITCPTPTQIMQHGPLNQSEIVKRTQELEMKLIAGFDVQKQNCMIPPSAVQMKTCSSLKKCTDPNKRQIDHRNQEMVKNSGGGYDVQKQSSVTIPSAVQTKMCPSLTKCINPNQSHVVRNNLEIFKNSGVGSDAQKQIGVIIANAVQTNLVCSPLTEGIYPTQSHFIKRKQELVKISEGGLDSHTHQDALPKNVQKKTPSKVPSECNPMKIENTVKNECRQQSITSRILQAETEKQNTKAAPFVPQAVAEVNSSIANKNSHENLKKKANGPSDRARISPATSLCGQKRGHDLLANMSNVPESILSANAQLSNCHDVKGNEIAGERKRKKVSGIPLPDEAKHSPAEQTPREKKPQEKINMKLSLDTVPSNTSIPCRPPVPANVNTSQNMRLALQRQSGPLLGRFPLPPTMIPPPMLAPSRMSAYNLTWEQQLDMYRVYLETLFDYQRKNSTSRTA